MLFISKNNGVEIAGLEVALFFYEHFSYVGLQSW